MAISSIKRDWGVEPSIVRITTSDSLATITTAGYLTDEADTIASLNNGAFDWQDSDFVAIYYSGGQGFFTRDAANATFVSEGSDVVTPTVANYLAHFTNTNGTISSAAADVINNGDIQAGIDASAGKFVSFPGTTASGTFALEAVDSSADVAVKLSNADHGQASVYSIPDGGSATANIAVAPAALVDGNVVTASGTDGVLQDGGFAVLANTTAAYGGGGASNAFTATGLGATSIVTASILASTNAVSIVKVVPTANTLTVDFGADPGASTTVSYVAVTPAV